MINRRSFITGIKSTKLNNQEIKFLNVYKPWGIILFARNLKTIKQIKKLTNHIKKIFQDNHYPILVDQEGGRVNRLSKFISLDTFTSKFFGDLFINDKKQFDIIYKLYIDHTSSLLNELGINLNTVPVLDLIYKGSANIIGNRSFSKKANIVSKIGDICIEHFNQNSIGTVIKHIPGHGLAKVDSHFSTPVIKKSLNYLNNNDFRSFKSKNSLFAMTAHIIFNKIDPINTVTHSKKMIKVIRDQIKFKNILISDDLSMKSLKYSIKNNTIKTFEAGCDIALHCNGNLKEMNIVAKHSPKINSFILKKTSEFYKIIS